jgi:uncharacterized DUF497 family protein
VSKENPIVNESIAFDVAYELEGTQFVWNSVKNKSNYQKHGITFEEAATVLVDMDTEYLEDEKHSNEEERFIAIGFSANEGMLTVCHCFRDPDLVIRIFSARRATKPERKKFESMKV